MLTHLADVLTFSGSLSKVSLAPKAVSEGGETNEEKISKQADILAEQVPKPFNIKVTHARTIAVRHPPLNRYHNTSAEHITLRQLTPR